MSRIVITPALLTSIFTGFKASFQAGFTGYPPMWQQIATLVPSTTLVETYGWLGAFPRIREWIGDRVINGLSSHDYSIKNRKWELTVGVDRDSIEDDRYGLFAPAMQNMGYETSMHPDDLIFSLLLQGFSTTCYDGQNFFDTDHPVGPAGQVTSVSNVQAGVGEPWFLMDLSRPLKPLIYQQRRVFEFTQKTSKETSDHVFLSDEYLYGTDGRSNAGFGFWQQAFGSKAALDRAAFRAARQAMQRFAGDNGRKLGIKPTHLIVGPGNSDAAREILLAEQKDGGGTNVDRNLATIIEVPYLAA